MKILIVFGHPRKESFCGAIANRYFAAATASGAETKYLNLAELHFEPNVIVPDPQKQFSEPDIILSREALLWAEHIVFVSPVWWGTVPGLFKSWLDRVFTPGFAFYERAEGDYKGLLAGRTARLILTLDTPAFIYRNFVKSPAVNSLKVATLQLCGISPVKTLMFHGVTHANEYEKKEWLKQVDRYGAWDSAGVQTHLNIYKTKLLPWIKALRLQFYPMTFFAYAVGAFTANHFGYGFSWLSFWLGYLLIFCCELVAVFVNDLQDLPSDKINSSYTPFNGGSRVLVEGELNVKQYKKALGIVSVIILTLIIVLCYRSHLPFYEPLFVISAGIFLGIFYSLPPLKLSYRTLGEITVGLSHSIVVLLLGFMLQNGNWTNPLPYVISLPIFLSIIPSITLSNIPDRNADRTVGKKTIAVLFGKKSASGIAFYATIASACVAIWYFLYPPGEIIFGNEIYFLLLHAILLCKALLKYMHADPVPRTINGLMVLSLSFMMWFVLAPFFRFI